MPPLSDHNLELRYRRVHLVAVVLPFALVPGDALIGKLFLLVKCLLMLLLMFMRLMAYMILLGARGGVLASDNLPGLDGGRSDD